MKIVLQRVTKASVTVDEKTVGSIDRGLLILLGIADGDTKEDIEKAVQKISKLRIFADKDGKTNLSVSDIDGEILVVSQFTLYADCRKGNRPSFIGAGKPDFANEMYEYFLKYAKSYFKKVEHGIFGADMKVSLVNDGPFTIIL